MTTSSKISEADKIQLKTFKQMLRLFERRHENLFQNKIHCCSWEQHYLEGAYDDCGVFVKYLKTRIKRLENKEKMTEQAFRYILTKHYPDIKFHGGKDCDDIWVIPLGNWGVDRVLFSKSEKHVRIWRTHSFDARIWRTHSFDHHFSRNRIEFERWVEKQSEKGNLFETISMD